MATVYSARHRNGDRVAIKVLSRDLAAQPTFRERFLREAYAANAVAHPGVVRVIDDDVTADDCPFLVMDMLDGETVEERRQKRETKTLSVDEVVDILVQLLDVLAAAHDKGVVHRDIKPANLFLEDDGTLRVLDFGIARVRDTPTKLTRPGALLGTPAFMAPEQARGRMDDIDGRTDLFSAAATAFLLLTGRPVFEGSSSVEIINAILSREPRSLASVASEHMVPVEIAEVIDRALARDPARRWPSAREMRDALMAASPLAAKTTAEPHPPVTVPSEEPITEEMLPPTHILVTPPRKADDDAVTHKMARASATLASPTAPLSPATSPSTSPRTAPLTSPSTSPAPSPMATLDDRTRPMPVPVARGSGLDASPHPALAPTRAMPLAAPTPKSRSIATPSQEGQKRPRLATILVVAGAILALIFAAIVVLVRG